MYQSFHSTLSFSSHLKGEAQKSDSGSSFSDEQSPDFHLLQGEEYFYSLSIPGQRSVREDPCTFWPNIFHFRNRNLKTEMDGYSVFILKTEIEKRD